MRGNGFLTFSSLLRSRSSESSSARRVLMTRWTTYSMKSSANAMSPCRTQPQMSMIQQKGDTVFFERNRIILGFLQNLELLDRELETERRTRIGAHSTCNEKRRFLGDMIRPLEDFR